MDIDSGALTPWWQYFSVSPRAWTWPGIAATLTAMGMLLSFHQVVRGAVEQGALRQKDTAQHARALWHCKALQGLPARDNCLSQLNPEASSAPPLQAVHIATGTPI